MKPDLPARTIPAVCLVLLDHWQKCDPAVVVTDGEDFWSLHPLEGDSTAVMFDKACTDRLLVEQSEPALLRVLARHLGWDGVGSLQLRARSRPPHARAWRLTAYDELGSDDGDWGTWLPDHISADLNYLEALGAAVCWYARVARVAAWDKAHEDEAADVYRRCIELGDPAGMTSEAAQIAYVEGYRDSPPFETSRGGGR